jgi:hypothetical protein
MQQCKYSYRKDKRVLQMIQHHTEPWSDMVNNISHQSNIYLDIFVTPEGGFGGGGFSSISANIFFYHYAEKGTCLYLIHLTYSIFKITDLIAGEIILINLLI